MFRIDRSFLVVATILSFGFTPSMNGQQMADPNWKPNVPQPEYAEGEGPIVLVDSAHNNFHTITGRYRPFADLLRADGYRVRDSNLRFKDPDFLDSIGGARIMVIANACSPSGCDAALEAFTEEEVSVIAEWVAAGGSLFLIFDHPPFASVTKLATALGVDRLTSSEVDGQDFFSRKDGTLNPGHFVTNGERSGEAIESVQTFSGSGFALTSPAQPGMDGTAIMTFGSGTSAEGLLQGAVIRSQEGRVYVSGEAGMFSAQISAGTLVGFNVPGAESNQQYLLNIIHWLDRCRPPDQCLFPKASFTKSPEEGETSSVFQFDGSGSTTPEGTAIIRYAWDFGDGTVADGAVVSHVYSRPGIYNVKFTITNDLNRMDRAWSTIFVRCPSPPTDLSPWVSADLGGPPILGNVSKDGDCLSLCAGGGSLLGNSDKFQFVYREMTGGFVITARIDAIEAGSFSQVALMVRASLDPKESFSAMGIAALSSGSNYGFYYRTSKGLLTLVKAGAKTSVPAWLRLQRQGDVMIGSSSADGSTWKEVGRVTIAGSPKKFYVGILGIEPGLTGDGSYQALKARICPTIAPDCNGNGADDAVDISMGTSKDCNGNGIPDECDISTGTSNDVDSNGFPDECLPPGGLRLPGDANGDGRLDISDAVAMLEFLFLGSPAKLPCGDGNSTDPGNISLLDWQPDGGIDISDAVAMLSFLFLGGHPHTLVAPLTETKSCVRIVGCSVLCVQ